ncbi:RNA-binding protein 7 [Episyrphus balteatus]|uniref:RNA-binding protein 7 n=1 Tax=Episyrphus balteatus TaxID=286459 RepID=UPI002485B859|nr:RNA-binding protein 7 [Episyrphus balteatus]
MYHQIKMIPNYPQRGETLEVESEDEDDESKRTIFCANLDQRVTEELLYEVFLQAGPIETVRIPKDNGGRQKTFGFITYIHKCSVSYALNLLAGLSLFRKNLTIKTKDQPAQSLPNDCEPLRRSGGRDNFALRGNNFNGGGNPFSRDKSPPKRIEWGSSNRRSDELQKHSSHNSRPHQISPYSRSDPSRDHGGGGGGGNHNRHNNNNRRSEQRNRHR